MDIQFGPNAIDEPNLLYKLQHKIKVFNTCDSLNNRGYNLIASSSKYGIVFIASPDSTLSVYYIKQLINKESDIKHVQVKLQEKPTHIGVSCDYELLAVTGGQLLTVYKIVDFQMQNVAPTCNIRCDVNPSNCVSALQWNPCIPDSIALAYFDGTLMACQVTTGQTKKIASKARCICWSPKGKQLVTGNSDGSLTQYKPDLTPAKTVPAPNLFENAPVEALAIYWISTFQFAVVFRRASDNSRPAVAVVNTPKAGQPSCLNYEDICYSSGPNRPWYYYLWGVPQWNIILASSSNSMEIATLGSADGASWLPWSQSDEARPELPLTDKKLENYPVGVCIDTGAIHQLPWGENETLPHMPLMMVLSHSGLLTIFNIINLNKQAPQICAPPQSLMLPANAMTSEIPGVSPAPAQPPPASVPPQPQSPPVLQPVNTQPFQPVQPTQTQQPPAGLFSSFTVPLKPAEPQPLAHLPQEVEQKLAIIQNIPPVVQPQARKVQTPKPAPEPKAVQSPEVNAALKEEQEKITKLKADQELKGMLLKEVNDFQNEVYKFNVKIRDGQNKLYKDINSLSSDFDLQSLNVDQLRKDYGLEDLRAAVVQLKLDLVRACAAVAETRTHTEMKDFHEWSHADPLTTKRVANIKKMAYYVQNQLEQAQKALDHKWSDMLSKNPLYNKPGHRMIRPILDDIYQPLVKQQEILGRQQAVLRTLRNTLNECNSSPVVKSTSILRSTPFRNKDNLSKLTKNILNMSIESQMPKSEGYLSAQKLDALRDLLANNRPTKIKPVTVEMTQHLKAVRLSYEKSLKEKAAQKAAPQPQAQIPQKVAEPAPIPQMKPQAKPDVVKPSQPSIQQSFSQISQQTTLPQSIPQSALPSFRSINNLKPNVPQAMNQSIQPGLANVARTLFSDQSSHELPRPQSSSTPIPPQQPKPQVAQEKIQPVSSVPTPTIDTKSVLKELLKSKSALANLESKNDNNTFLGQKICSPTNFTFSSNTSTPSSTNFADKSSIFKTLQPDPQVKEIKALSDETGEIETSVKPNDAKIEEKSIFDIKTSTSLSASSQFVPDVLKSATQGFGVKAESKTLLEKPDSQENVTDKNKAVPLKLSTKGNVTKAEESKPTLFASSQVQPIPATPEDKTEEKPADKTPENPAIVASSASSIFASANASKPVIGAATSSIFGAVSSSETSKSLFSSLQTPQQSSSIFSPTIVSSTSQMGSIFGSKSATTSIEIKPIETDSEKVSIASIASPVTTGTDAKSIFGSSASETSEITEVPKTESSSKIEIAPTTSATIAFATTAPESKPSIFSTPTPATSAPVFGNQSAFAITKPSVFGSSASSVFASANTQQPTSIFGATATTTQTVFGGTTTTTQSAFAPTTKESAFAAAPLFGAATTAQSAFGSTTATTQASIFGTATAPTQSIFGSPTTQASVFGGQQTSVFGSPAQATAPTTQSSVFGAPTTQAFSIFSTGGSNTTQTSIFGAQPVTTTSGGSLFGGGESNLFAAASISTTNAPSQVTGSIFGGSTGSAFSNTGANVFGGKTTFGQPNPAAASIFGSSPVSGFGQKQDTANNFWGNNSKPESDSSSNWFGKEQPTTQASSIFGGTTGGSFSAPAPGGAFGSPQPQGSVFGTPPQQKGPGFGGSAGFGSKAVFGQSTGFGSPPATGGFGSFGGFNKSPATGFGGPAAFGAASAFGAPAFGSTSPGKVFGGATDAGPAFGATQSNSTFENLATQNTLSFGNLAQQSQTPPAAPSFNTSPSFTGWRG